MSFLFVLYQTKLIFTVNLSEIKKCHKVTVIIIVLGNAVIIVNLP